MRSDLSPVVTIDGPGGSGKGTVGVRLAKTLGWHFLDSGALYRILALWALREGIGFHDAPALARLALRLEIVFQPEGIQVEDQWITTEIRNEACGKAASQIALLPEVRAALFQKQQAFKQAPGLVADGRDMGTVIFPLAEVKIFLEASAEERAKRRYLELLRQGQDVNLESLLEELKARDIRDKERVISPLIPAKEAVVIDTTGRGVESVFEQVLKIVQGRLY